MIGKVIEYMNPETEVHKKTELMRKFTSVEALENLMSAYNRDLRKTLTDMPKDIAKQQHESQPQAPRTFDKHLPQMKRHSSLFFD